MKDFGCTAKMMTNHNVQINLLFEILKENCVYDALNGQEKKFQLLDLGPPLPYLSNVVNSLAM